MKTIDIIRRAGRSLSQAKTRTILTSLAIGVGAFTITLSLAAGAGGRQYATDLISANTDTSELRDAEIGHTPEPIEASGVSGRVVLADDWQRFYY